MKYEFILIDADETLFDFQAAQTYAFESLFDHIGVTYEDKFLSTYREINENLWRLLEQGKITKAALQPLRFERLMEALGIKGYTGEALNNTFLDFLGQGSQLLPGALALCQALHGKAITLLATNGIKRTQESRFQNSALVHLIDYVAISEAAGYTKPDSRFFDYAFDLAGNPPKEKAIMLGDSLTADILGAGNYGIAACWFNPQGKKINDDFPCPPEYEIKELMDFLRIIGI